MRSYFALGPLPPAGEGRKLSRWRTVSNRQIAAAAATLSDSPPPGMGMRSRRYALYADDGIVRALWVEAPGEFRVSSAEHVLANLPAD